MPDSSLPGDVRATIGRRVELLADDTRRMLAAASVLGRRFDLAHPRGDHPLDPDVVIGRARRGRRGRGDRRRGRRSLPFAHALVEDTLYDASPPTRRAATPRRGRGGPRATRARPTRRSPTIAYHYCRALPAGDRDPGRGVRAARRSRRGRHGARPSRRCSTTSGRAKRRPVADVGSLGRRWRAAV